jgi:hypothetical protein
MVTSFFLRHEQIFGALFAVQVGFYGLVLVGAWQNGTSRLNGLVRLPFVFLMANLAVFTGVLDACRRKTFATWNVAALSRGSNS